jgi:hypothetical protein
MGLQENLALALEVINAIDALGYQSSNRGAQLDGLSAELSDTRGGFATFLAERTNFFMYEDMGSSPHQDLMQEIEKILAPAAVGRRLRFANCEARAALALVYATKHSLIRPLELCGLVGGDHALMVIGRTAGLVTNIDGWNNDAVICDPWARDCYAKGLFKAKLDQPPLAAVKGNNQNALLSYYARIEAGALPVRWKHFLDQYGISDIWP